MFDNLFIVESPLQALVAVELSLQFEGQRNGVIYRLCGKGRERSDQQIRRVIDLGRWSLCEPLTFVGWKGVSGHLKVRKGILQLKKRFKGKVRNLFFGEFRSQWMHFARFAIAPEKFVLMDDGAVTLIVKRRYIDKGVFYPRHLWVDRNPVKKMAKNAIYWGIFEPPQAQRGVTFASAFLGADSEYVVNFSLIRQRMAKLTSSDSSTSPKAYYFGSKYSEAGIVSQDYELGFLVNVIEHYRKNGLDVVYCAHRDESEEKLHLIGDRFGIEVLCPDLPAELFVLERDECVAEICAAYSSVINNLRLIFPDKPMTSFRLNQMHINPLNRDAIADVYDHFVKEGVLVLALGGFNSDVHPPAFH